MGSSGSRGHGRSPSARKRAEGSPAGEGEEADPHARAREIALRLLTHAPRTHEQLREALRRRDVPDETAEEVLGKLGDVGLVDDAAFASAWVESRHRGRGLARRALAAELRTRGVDDGTVSETVDELDPDEEAATARRLVERRLAATRGLAPERRMRRLAGMLARKGYSSGLAYRVVREALEAAGEGTEHLPEGPADDGGPEDY